MADAAPGVGVGDVNELPHGVLAIADDVCRDPFGHRNHVAAHDQHAVIVAGHITLEHDGGTVSLVQRPLVTRSDCAFVPEVEHDPSSVIPVDGLGDHRVPDPPGGHSGLVFRAHDL